MHIEESFSSPGMVCQSGYAKIPFRFIYTSAPARGLDLLLKIFPAIKAKMAKASLVIATYNPHEVTEEQKVCFGCLKQVLRVSLGFVGFLPLRTAMIRTQRTSHNTGENEGGGCSIYGKSGQAGALPSNVNGGCMVISHAAFPRDILHYCTGNDDGKGDPVSSWGIPMCVSYIVFL